MSEHVITIDTPLASHIPTDDFAARAYCTDECGWAGDWHHADEFPLADWDAKAAAYDAASADGWRHLTEV